MALTIDELLKIGLGVLVAVVIIVGISWFVKNNAISFIKGLYSGDAQTFFLALR